MESLARYTVEEKRDQRARDHTGDQELVRKSGEGGGVAGQPQRSSSDYSSSVGTLFSSSSSLSSSSSSCSVSAYLRLSADPIPPEAMWRFGRAMAASIGQLGAAAARSRSLSSSPTNRRPPAPLPGGAGHGFRV